MLNKYSILQCMSSPEFYITVAILELNTLLPQPFKCLGYRYTPRLASLLYFNER